MANNSVTLEQFRDACAAALSNVTGGNTSDSVKATLKYDDKQGNKLDVSYKSPSPPPAP